MSFRISLRLPNDLYEKIQKVSDSLSDNLSDTCRTAIEYFISQKEQKKISENRKENGKTLNQNYINQLKDEIIYLKEENKILREQIETKIFNLQNQLNLLLTNQSSSKKIPYKKIKKEKTKNEKELFITRM